MQRRKALATAGAISVTALAATIALGANLGLFGLTDNSSGPGNFAPVGAHHASVTRTEVVDVPALTGDSPTSGASATGDAHAPHDESREGHRSEGHEDD